MPEEKDKDVQVVPSPASEKEEGDVEPESDKDKNFAELRKKAKTLEKERDELKAKLEQKESVDRTLDITPKEEKKPEKDTSDTLKILFDRDMKKAVNRWTSKNKVSGDEWAAIKGKIALKGDETDDEIYAKIDEAYETIPSVKQRREKELIDKGKKEAMREFQDDELDLGGGGDIDLGGGAEPRFTPKEKKWLDGFGVKQEDRKQIDKSGDTSKETILDPARK